MADRFIKVTDTTAADGIATWVNVRNILCFSPKIGGGARIWMTAITGGGGAGPQHPYLIHTAESPDELLAQLGDDEGGPVTP